MSLATQLSTLVIRIGTEFKSVRISIGDLSTLTTTAKGSVVAALNEVKASSGAGVAINDTTASTSSVYSSTKTNSAIAAAIAALVASAPAALDTLNEFAVALGNDANFSTTTATSLGLKATKVEVGDTTTDFVAAFNAAIV